MNMLHNFNLTSCTITVSRQCTEWLTRFC